jgi:hypothetical protein
MFSTVAKAFKAERTLTYVKNARANRLAHQLWQLGDVRRNPSRLNSDTGRMAGNKQTEEKYEHTNRKGSKKTPVWAPRYSGLGGDDGPSAFLRRTFVQIERLYSQALHSQAT